jgi:hypothetical protein
VIQVRQNTVDEQRNFLNNAGDLIEFNLCISICWHISGNEYFSLFAWMADTRKFPSELIGLSGINMMNPGRVNSSTNLDNVDFFIPGENAICARDSGD